MIKSKLGVVEISGRSDVICAESVVLMKALREALGNECFEKIVEDSKEENLSKKFGSVEEAVKGFKSDLADLLKEILGGLEDEVAE